MKAYRRTRGFTLIELVAVVAILVALVSLTIPRIDALQNKTNKGVSASNQHSVARSIMLYKAMHNSYPDTWDSLLTGASGSLWKAADPTSKGLEPQLTGGFGSSSSTAFPAKLTEGTLNDAMVESLSRTGIVDVFDKAATVGAPGDAFSATRGGLKSGDKIAIVNNTDVTDASQDEDAANIWREAFPGKTDAEIKDLQSKGVLAAFGVGPRNKMIGDNMLTVPNYANVDPNKYYNRFIALFYVRNNAAKRAFLRTVVASDGDRMAEEVADFYEVDE
jgi:prepilin-type N-terminal cleavage/methylation domain-containing protein